ncbi:MAG: hypothetical protein KGL03_05230 [Nitrospirota bacterium]|nr:hypothetical protein [Nitrospirota bacterium]
MLVVGSLAGCSTLDRQEDLEQLENKLASNASAEDYLAAALLYQRQAQRLEIQASRYEQEAAVITPLEDPKEFRRAGLRVVAQLRRKQAEDFLQLVADHRQKAEKMLNSQKPRE